MAIMLPANQEETGKISYVQDGDFCKFKDLEDLKNLIVNDLAN